MSLLLETQSLGTDAQNLYLGANNSIFATIDNSGNLGLNGIKLISNSTILNINSPLSKTGSIFALYNNSTSNARITSNNTGSIISTENGHIRFGTNALKRFSINSEGALGIGGAWTDISGSTSASFGTANQVLVSQGPTAAPTWTTLDNNAIAASAGIVYSKLSLTNSIVNADINSSASISDTKLATISTAGKVSNSATTATATAGTANSIVLRDGNGYISTNYFNSADDVSSGTITYLIAKFGDNYFRSATAAKVAAFLSGQSMDISGNATTVSGLSIWSNVGANGRGNEANKIVRTDANGYIQAWVMNSSNGDENNASAPSRVWGSNSSSDLYLRTYNPAYLRRYFYSASHPDDYYLANNWDGSYWYITSNHTTPSTRVAYADVSDTSTPNNGSITVSTLDNNMKGRIFKAYVMFGGTYGIAVGGNVTLTTSFNISSVTCGPTNTVRFTLNFAENLGTSNYCWVGNSGGFYWAHALALCMSTSSTSAQFTTVACGNWHGAMGEQQSANVSIGIF